MVASSAAKLLTNRRIPVARVNGGAERIKEIFIRDVTRIMVADANLGSLSGASAGSLP
jgi:hypothetical protein